MSRKLVKSILVGACTLLALSNCKKKEEPAIIEEAPPKSTVETDTSATLSEEPSLKQVGKEGKSHDKKGKGKNTHDAAEPSASATEAGFSGSGRIVVQVSIFKSKREAAALVGKLASAGYPAYVAEVENPVPSMPGTWHRVRVGTFKTISEAKAFGENTLVGMGYQYWIDNKKNDAVGGDGTGSSYMAPEASEPAAYEAPAEPKPKKSKRGKKVAPIEESIYSPSSSPSTESTPSESTSPSSETWGNTQPVTPSVEEKAMETPVEATPEAAPLPTPSAKPADTGKVNLDEW